MHHLDIQSPAAGFVWIDVHASADLKRIAFELVEYSGGHTVHAQYSRDKHIQRLYLVPVVFYRIHRHRPIGIEVSQPATKELSVKRKPLIFETQINSEHVKVSFFNSHIRS